MSDGIEEYIVDRVVDIADYNKSPSHRFYLTRWLGYGPCDDTWESMKSFDDSEQFERCKAQLAAHMPAMLNHELLPDPYVRNGVPIPPCWFCLGKNGPPAYRCRGWCQRSFCAVCLGQGRGETDEPPKDIICPDCAVSRGVCIGCHKPGILWHPSREVPKKVVSGDKSMASMLREIPNYQASKCYVHQCVKLFPDRSGKVRKVAIPCFFHLSCVNLWPPKEENIVAEFNNSARNRTDIPTEHCSQIKVDSASALKNPHLKELEAMTWTYVKTNTIEDTTTYPIVDEATKKTINEALSLSEGVPIDDGDKGMGYECYSVGKHYLAYDLSHEKTLAKIIKCVRCMSETDDFSAGWHVLDTEGDGDNCVKWGICKYCNYISNEKRRSASELNILDSRESWVAKEMKYSTSNSVFYVCAHPLFDFPITPNVIRGSTAISKRTSSALTGSQSTLSHLLYSKYEEALKAEINKKKFVPKKRPLVDDSELIRKVVPDIAPVNSPVSISFPVPIKMEKMQPSPPIIVKSPEEPKKTRKDFVIPSVPFKKGEILMKFNIEEKRAGQDKPASSGIVHPCIWSQETASELDIIDI